MGSVQRQNHNNLWVVLLIMMQLLAQIAQRRTPQQNSTAKGVLVEALFFVPRQITSAGAAVTAQLVLI